MLSKPRMAEYLLQFIATMHIDSKAVVAQYIGKDLLCIVVVQSINDMLAIAGKVASGQGSAMETKNRDVITHEQTGSPLVKMHAQILKRYTSLYSLFGGEQQGKGIIFATGRQDSIELIGEMTQDALSTRAGPA